jgi:GT2 family glycosyltransferase
VDADTIVMPNLISEFVKSLRRKNVVGVTCPILPSNMEIRYQLFFQLTNFSTNFSSWIKRPQVSGMCCGYKRDAFEKVGGFNEELKICEDLDLSKRIAKYGKIIFTNKTFAITSVRRIKKWGVMKTIRKYVSNYFNYTLRNKTFTLREYKPVRKV